MRRTRIKICGIRRVEDALEAARLGADAIGLIFYPGSPRVVTVREAATIKAALPSFVSTVALFVDAAAEDVQAVIAGLDPSILQFHGDESNDFCAQFGRPFMKAIRVSNTMRPDDLLQCANAFPSASALLLDTFSTAGHGGTGAVFDWSVIPVAMRPKIVLAGGLLPETVGGAVAKIKPWAVDVSSGVEASKGIKDHLKLARFMAAVQAADASAEPSTRTPQNADV